MHSEDTGIVRTKIRYKITLENILFRKPFVNCNFSDMDNFTLTFETDGTRIICRGCMWEDIEAAADSKSFSEHISISALNMNTEEI